MILNCHGPELKTVHVICKKLRFYIVKFSVKMTKSVPHASSIKLGSAGRIDLGFGQADRRRAGLYYICGS
jgi:hypothetical protein